MFRLFCSLSFFSGKTSFITALAGQLGYNIYVLNLGSQSMTNEMLIDLLSLTPQRCILLLEDIDAAMSESGKVIDRAD